MDNKHAVGFVTEVEQGHTYALRNRDSDSVQTLQFCKMHYSAEGGHVDADGVFTQDVLRVMAMRLMHQCLADPIFHRVKALEGVLMALQAMDESVVYRHFAGIYHTTESDCQSAFYLNKGLPAHLLALYDAAVKKSSESVLTKPK